MQSQSSQVYSIMTLVLVVIVSLTPMAAQMPLPKPTKYAQVFSIKKKRKKKLRKTMQVVGMVVTIGTVVIVTYLKYQVTKALQHSQNEVDALKQEKDQLQAQGQREKDQLRRRNNHLQQEKDQVQQRRNQLQQENRELQQENRNQRRQETELQRQNSYLQRQNSNLQQNSALHGQSIFSFSANIDKNKTEHLHHQYNVRHTHEATGCTNHEFTRALYNSVQANKNPDTDQFFDEIHLTDFFTCAVCQKKIPISYLANGVAFYYCTNYQAHADKGGFHVCRSCASGKQNPPCSRCGANYVQLFPYESKDLCLICVGYDTQQAALTKILTTADLPLPELDTRLYGDDYWYAYRTHLKDKKIEDPHAIEEITYKVKEYERRYTYLNPDKPLKDSKEKLKNTIECYKDDIQHYESIMSLFNRNGDDVEIITNVYCHVNSWEKSIESEDHKPINKHLLNIYWIRSLRESENEAYLILENRAKRCMGIRGEINE